MNETAPAADVAAADRRRRDVAGGRWFSPLLALPTPLIFLAAAALAMFVLWRNGALADIGSSIRHIHPAAIIGVLVVYGLSIIVLSIRWHMLVRMADGVPDWTASAEVFLTSVVVNYAAPIGLAVPTRAALTVRDLRLTPGRSAEVVLWEVGLDVAVLTLISTLWLVRGGSDLLRTVPVDGRIIVIAGGVFIVAALVIIIVSRAASMQSRVIPFAQRLLSSPTRHPKLTILAITLTVVFWTMQIGVMASLLRVFGATPDLSLLLGLMGLPVLIGMLSPIPGGAGIREALMAAAARLGGVPAGPVILAAVSYRLALFLVTPIVWGLVRLARRKRVWH